MKNRISGMFLISALFAFTNTWAGGIEVNNGCKGTTNDPCMRSGFCSIQGSDWEQLVTAGRRDKFDTQGWPGLCDMVHVALVQGNCMESGSQTNVTAYLSANSFAQIIEIVGSLSCGGDDGGSSSGGGGGNFCDSHPNHRKCQ
jgi:hypothetical protein